MNARTATIGPERFRVPTGQDRPSPLRSILAGLVLLLIIVGLPVLMLQFLGLPPIPTSLDASLLMQQVSVTVLMGVLIWVLWLAWLQFTVCTVVELVSALRGRGVPAHVPLSGGPQALARKLVTAMLLVSAMAAPAAAAAPVLPAQAPAGVQAQVEASGQTASQAAPASAPGDSTQDPQARPAEGVRYMLGDIELDAQTGAELEGKRVYVVQPPDGRYHDNLWDIAERNLGEGRSYPEIYDLNVGRLQPDGRSLELARLIQPGWLLVMPESAESVDRVVAVPVTNPA
ncbi:LysM peptidoglycan-binding domain-containing protein, partial [Actinomyces slackii]